MRHHVHALAWALALGLVPGVAFAQNPQGKDQPIDLGSSATNQDLNALTGENAHPLQITGFAVGDNTYDGRTHENSFAASTLALSLFKELSDNVWFFGQLTTSLGQPDSAGGDVPTETEIDNLIISITPPGASNLSVAIGKFDDPLGFERDDAPLNFEPTQSYNYTLGRAGKFVGAIGRWTVSPHLGVAAWVDNGWDAALSANHGKSAGARVGYIGGENFSLGLGGTYGPEGVQGASADRYLFTFDYAYQPAEGWILGGEANWGGDRGVNPGGSDARWYGAMATVFRRMSRHVGVVARAEAFKDRDGARTGTPQTLTSFTLAPVYLLGTGREGIFANIEHTTFRIPRFQIRAEARLNHSTAAVFPTATGTDTWTMQYDVQLVATF